MRRILAPVLMISLIFVLTACGGTSKGREAFDEFRERYNALEAVSLTADVTADCGGSVYKCRLLYESGSGREAVTVLSPEEISGVTASLKEDGAALEFGGVMLDAGEPDGSGLTPMSSLFAVSREWREGVFQEASLTKFAEQDCWQVTFAPEETPEGGQVTQTLIFTKDKCLPLFAELYSGGERMITVEFVYQ